MITQCQRTSSITNVNNYKPWQTILTSIIKAINKRNQDTKQSSHNLEIQLKYCFYEPNHREIGRYQIIRQLSYKSAIHYFGQRTGFTAGYFDQKKFYGMREYLLNVCKCNQERLPQCNFYSRIKKNYSNYKYKYKGQELRMDLNKDDTRHTYTIGKGWSKMKKSRANDPLDLIFCQSEFRLTFNKQQQSEFVLEDLVKSMNEAKKPWIRIKNITKFEKNDQIELALSQVLEIDFKKQNFRTLLLDIINSPQQLQNLIIGYFTNFYNELINPRNQSAQFQIESQVLQQKYQSLSKQLAHNQDLLVESFFERMLQDFQSLKWADYSIMWQETATITQLYKSKNKTQVKQNKARFETVRGDYMRNQIRNFMHAVKP